MARTKQLSIAKIGIHYKNHKIQYEIADMKEWLMKIEPLIRGSNCETDKINLCCEFSPIHRQSILAD